MSHQVPAPLQPQQDTLDGLQAMQAIEKPPSNLSERRDLKAPNPLSIHVLALLIPASIFGVLARLGLHNLATYDGNSIFPLAFPQAIGCLVMGFALGLKEQFDHFHPPLYTALTTGFCGSLTTFSGWQLDTFNSWINASLSHRSGFKDFIDGLEKSVFTLLISISSVSFGNLLASVALPLFPTLTPPNRTIRYSLTILSILTYAAVFPIYFLMAENFRHQATAALLFAFPGTLTRYILSSQLNSILPSIPLGTFVANSIGTALLGGLTVLQAQIYHPLSPGVCSLLQGLSDGYCGCLTTVSTLVVEVRGMAPGKGAKYTLLSWSIGQILLLLIVGCSTWSGHAREQVTCTFV